MAAAAHTCDYCGRDSAQPCERRRLRQRDGTVEMINCCTACEARLKRRALGCTGRAPKCVMCTGQQADNTVVIERVLHGEAALKYGSPAPACNECWHEYRRAHTSQARAS